MDTAASVHARDLRDELMRRFEHQDDDASGGGRDRLALEVAHALGDFDARAMQPVDAEVRADLQAQLQAKMPRRPNALGSTQRASRRPSSTPSKAHGRTSTTTARPLTISTRSSPSRTDAITPARWQRAPILHERIASRWFPR